MAWGLIVILLLGSGLAFPVPDTEFVFIKKYQTGPNSHYLWDTKFKTQALLGSPELHWNAGTFLPNDSGIVLRANPPDQVYQDFIALPPHNLLTQWPPVSLAPSSSSDGYWALSFWFRKSKLTADTVLFTKHVSIAHELLAIYYTTGSKYINVGMSALDSSGNYQTGSANCDSTKYATDWNHIVVRIDTSVTGATSVLCVVNGAQTTNSQTLSTAQWKDAATEPLYVMASGFSGNSQPLWLYNVAFFFQGMSSLSDFSTTSLQNCGMSTGPGLSCDYCPYGLHTCLLTCDLGTYLDQTNTCQSCGDVNCAVCSGANQCTSCNIGYYLAADSQICVACDGRCAHCWGPNNSQCYACKTPQHDYDTNLLASSTWMVANNTCEGQPSLLQANPTAAAGTFWTAPVTLPVPEKVGNFSEFSVDFWVKLSNAAGPDLAIVGVVIDFGRFFFAIKTTDNSLYFQDFKTLKSKTVGTYTQSSWVLATYAMDRYRMRLAYAAAKQGPTTYLFAPVDNTQSSTTSVFQYEPPTIIVLNGHHSYANTRTACGFNNIRIWGRFRTMQDLLSDVGVFYTPLNAPPHLLVNYPVLSADKSFLVNSVLIDPTATVVNWNLSPFEYVDQLNATSVLPGNPANFYTNADANRRGDYSPAEIFNGISICPFSQKSVQPAMFGSSALCRDQLRFRFDKKTVAQRIYDSFSYKHLRLGTSYAPDQYDPSFSVSSAGTLNEAGLLFTKSMLVLPPTPPEDTVPALQIRTSMTFEAWIKPTALSKVLATQYTNAIPQDASTIFSMATQRAWPTRVLYLQQVSSGSYTLSYFTKALYQNMAITSSRLDLKTGLSVGNWMHIAIVTDLYTSTVGYVAGYVNGKLVYKTLQDPSAASNPGLSTKDLIWEPYATPIVGATNQFGQWTAFFQGNMFEFDMFNYARSDSEIASDTSATCPSSCTICPSYSGACLSSAVMTGSFPVCASTCKTCTDGAPSSCLSCYPGTFLDGTSCVQYCSGSNLGNTVTNICESVTTVKTSGTTAVLDGLNLVLTFQSAFRFVSDCKSAFDGNSQNALGELFNCKWDSTHTVLTVRLGTRATVVKGDSLTIANNGLTPNPTSPLYVMSSFSVSAVTENASLVDLRASIGVTQDKLSKCQDLVFTAVGSTGPRIQFAWQFYVFPLDSAEGKVPGSFAVYSEQNFQARVPQPFFAQAKSLQAVLFIRDMFSRVRTVNYTYSLSYSEIPTAYFPYGNYNITIFRGNAYVFPLDIKETNCPGHTQKPKRSVTVTWTLLTTNATGTSGATAIASSAIDHNLKLAAFSMDTLQWYQFQAQVRDDTYGVSTVLNTTMTVVQRPLVPIILGGNRWVSITETLILDGKLSYDPDYTTTVLSYCWSVTCTFTGSSSNTISGCLTGTTYSCTPGNTTTVLQLNPLSLATNGVYIFTLTVTDGIRSSSATTEIDTVSPVIPIVELYPNTTYYPYKFPSTQSITLYGTITNAARSTQYLTLPAFVNNNEETIPFWSVSPYIPNAFSSPDFVHVTQLTGFNPNAGDSYRVTLTVDDLLQRGKAWINAASNTPPRGGVVYISPSWAVPAFSEVQFSAERFWDDDIPLSYEFYRVQGSSRTLIGRRYNYGLLGQLVVPLSPNPVYHEVWVYDNNNDANVYPITAVGSTRPASPDPHSWFSQANQAIASYLLNDVDVAYTNALTFAESLATAVEQGLIDARSPAFSGVVGGFLGVLGTGALTAACQDANLRLQIITTLGQYADSLSADVNQALQANFTALVTASGSCFSAKAYTSVFQSYVNFQMNAGTLPDLISQSIPLDGELVITQANSEIVIKRDQFENFYSDPVSGAHLKVGADQVTITPAAFKLNPTDCIDTRVIVYSYNPVDSAESISDVIDVSFSQSCSYAYRQEPTMTKPTSLALATNANVTVTLNAKIDALYFIGAVCNLWDDVVGWTYGPCKFQGADLVAGTVTCTCKKLGIIAAFIDQTPSAPDARTFQKPTINLFDFSLSDLEYGPETTVDGQYYMNRMNPNYLQLIFFGLYLIGAVILMGLDNKDMKGECRRREVPFLWYLLREHILFSLFLSPYRTSKVTRVSRAYVLVTVTHGILAVGGLFYFNNMEQIRDNDDRYRNKDYLVAVYIGLVGMLIALILKTAFNPRLTTERLIGYSLATCFNVLFFIMCVWYTANMAENTANHWMLTWFLGWATYLAVLDFLVTLVIVLFFDCLTISIKKEGQDDESRPRESEIEIPLQQPEPSEEMPEARQVPYIIAPQDPKAERKRRRDLRRARRDQLFTPQEQEMKRLDREAKKRRRLDEGYTSSEDSEPDVPGGMHEGDEDIPENPISTRR